MDHFDYRPVAAPEGAHELHVEGVAIAAIADRFGTPTYVYSAATLREHYDRLVDAFRPLSPLVCYSIKSSGNLAILRLLAERGAGMDVVSGGELHRALAAGVSASRCVYAGVGKTDAENTAAQQGEEQPVPVAETAVDQDESNNGAELAKQGN